MVRDLEPAPMRPRPVLHKTETEIETDYYETETETKNVVSRPCWF